MPTATLRNAKTYSLGAPANQTFTYGVPVEVTPEIGAYLAKLTVPIRNVPKLLFDVDGLGKASAAVRQEVLPTTSSVARPALDDDDDTVEFFPHRGERPAGQRGQQNKMPRSTES
jgi:hypothetical protein